MLTKKDLKRKKFNQSELKKIPNVVFTPTTKINLPQNLDLLLYLLRQLQTRNYYEKYKCDLYLLELQKQKPSEELESQIKAAKKNSERAEYVRHHTHTIYTQILLHLFHTKQLELLYVQSYESKPNTKNVLSVDYGGYTHRFQIKAAHLEGFNLEDRGISLKPDPAQIAKPVTDEQMLNEFGYAPIEVVRECRRLSNYLTNRARSIREKNTKITIHNTIVGQIKKMAADGEVTITDDTKPRPEAVTKEAPQSNPKAKEQQKQAQATVKPLFKKPSGNRQTSSIKEPSAKKPISVIRKRTFQLNK